MAAAIEIWNDLLNNRLVQGLNSNEAFRFGTLYQGSKLSIRYFPILPILGAIQAPFYKKVDLSNLTLEIAVGPRAGTESLKAFQGTWTKQTGPDSEGVSGYMYADLDLNTSDLNTAIGTLDTYSTYLEARLSESGVKRVTYQTDLIITSVVMGPGAAGSLPTPAAEYFTKAEMLELFVSWDNTRVQSRGKAVRFASGDGTATRTLGVNNDKSPQDDLT